jgi:FtsZ-interacting cell division protein ZipA
MMTTLQIVLAIVGVVLIAVIVIYNLLQERRFRKEAEKMFSHKREDVMLGESVSSESNNQQVEPGIRLSEESYSSVDANLAVDEADTPLPSLDMKRQLLSGSILSSLEPIEPSLPEEPVLVRSTLNPANAGKLGEIAAASPRPAPKSVSADEPTKQPILKSASVPPSRPATEPPVSTASTARASAVEFGDATTQDISKATFSGLDRATEYIARLKFVAPTVANFGPLLATLRRIGKPVRAFGHRADGVWEVLSSHPRSTVDQVEFGLQLADRSGALSQDHLDAFTRALYEFAAEEGGAVTCPDKQEALVLARDLDLFCMDVDVLIGLNVISADSRPFTSEAMHGLAQEAGLMLETDGSFHARDAFGHTLFTLANQGEDPFPRDGRGLTTHGVTLLFDVPRVADGLAVFDRMTHLGFDLAARLEGRMVDDNGRVVSEESLNRDRARLLAFYQRMEARGIPAGGERSLRLFV